MLHRQKRTIVWNLEVMLKLLHEVSVGRGNANTYRMFVEAKEDIHKILSNDFDLLENMDIRGLGGEVRPS